MGGEIEGGQEILPVGHERNKGCVSYFQSLSARQHGKTWSIQMSPHQGSHQHGVVLNPRSPVQLSTGGERVPQSCGPLTLALFSMSVEECGEGPACNLQRGPNVSRRLSNKAGLLAGSAAAQSNKS